MASLVKTKRVLWRSGGQISEYFDSVVIMCAESTPRRRKWDPNDMRNAYHEAIRGHLRIAKASKLYNVPRTSLVDRISGRVKLDAKMGTNTALSTEIELSLVSYISYMADRGFPLTISEICGYAWCIAKEHDRANTFSENGPSRKWWRDFKSRHPEISLRCPDSLDRWRAATGNENVIKEYFDLLKNTLKANDLKDKPERLYNCDEAGLYLNKFSGQRVVVPKRSKHAHTFSAATSDHVSVHCCVNTAGTALPPMVIFSGGLIIF